MTPHINEMGSLKKSLGNSLHKQYVESLTFCINYSGIHWLGINKSQTWRLPKSTMLGVANSPHHWYAELVILRTNDAGNFLKIIRKVTPCINDMQSRRLSVPTMQGVCDFRILDSGELILNYDYFRELEAKIVKALLLFFTDVLLLYHLLSAQSWQSARLFIQSSELGPSPTPSPAGECVPSSFGSGGEDILACGRGVEEVPSRTRGQTLWYSS